MASDNLDGFLASCRETGKLGLKGKYYADVTPENSVAGERHMVRGKAENRLAMSAGDLTPPAPDDRKEQRKESTDGAIPKPQGGARHDDGNEDATRPGRPVP